MEVRKQKKQQKEIEREMMDKDKIVLLHEGSVTDDGPSSERDGFMIF